MNEWPDARAFRENWPLLALDLLIADWKIGNAFSLFESGEIQVEQLYPAKPEERDWRDTYKAELAAHPELASDLPMDGEDDQGDGIELVLDRAELRDNERWVVRDHLYGKSIELISEDSGVKPQTLQNLLNNALARLKGLRDTTSGGPQRKRRVVGGKQPRRAGRGHVSGPAAASAGAHEESRSRRGSRAGDLPHLRPQAAGSQNGHAAQALDADGHAPSQHRFVQAVG